MSNEEPGAEKCKVCGETVPFDNDHYEPRFLYAYCDVHGSVPPAYMDKAIAQFKATGKTQWDVKS